MQKYKLLHLSEVLVYICDMVNPNKYIREAYVTALSGIGVPVFAKKIPKSETPTPRKYLLISSQTKNEYAKDKDGFDWITTIAFDIVNVNEKGFSDPEKIDDIEESVMNAQISVPRFNVIDIKIADSTDLDSETTTQSIDRRILTLEIWLNNID